MSKKYILALCLDAEVAWATRARDGGAIHSTDSFRSKQVESSGFRALRFRNYLAELCSEAKVQAIVFLESRSTAHTQWIVHLQEFGKRADIPIRGVTAGAVKKHTAGSGSASKEAVLAAIVALRYTPANDAEAMALATLRYAEFERLRKGEAA